MLVAAMTHPSLAPTIFLEAANAMRSGVPMIPRSASDKEYFPQDWFIDRVDAVRFARDQQGRNSYPDFWVTSGNVTEGYEIKSLAFERGRPARSDYDCNSTVPSGRKGNRDIFLAFFLYTGRGDAPRPVHSLAIAHADVINCDFETADEHENPAIHDFGSFGDGFIRNRKMYVFPTPFTIHPPGIGRASLIVPADWNIADPRLVRVAQIGRAISPTRISGYTIHLKRGDAPNVIREPFAAAAPRLVFDVFEAR